MSKRSSHRNIIIKSRGEQKRNTSKKEDVSFKIIPYTIPKTFSLIDNSEESISIFKRLETNFPQRRIKHVINMRQTKNMTMEVLLYLISLKNIWKKKKHKFKIQIQSPECPELRSLLAISGLGKYFRGDTTEDMIERNIFPMCDGGQETLDPQVFIPQNDRCIEINEYSFRMMQEVVQTDEKEKYIKQTLFCQLNAIAEMIRNTDDHAYKKDPFKLIALRNWYFFAARVEKGVSFYFLDNGQGIINTATKKVKDKTEYFKDSTPEIKVLADALKGKFRTRTKLKNRGKGLPEINDFFQQDCVIQSTIITNNVICNTFEGDRKIERKKNDFNGTLFAWIIK